MEEVWKDIDGFEGYYQVSNLGKVKSVDRYVKNSSLSSGIQHIKEKMLKPSDNGSGYLFVALCKNRKYSQKTIHTLVANAFILNPENKPTVNHKDGNKYNNCVENLEWATYQEQSEHAVRIGLKTGWSEDARRRVGEASKARESKAVRCITTGEVFPSMRQAEIAYGLGSSTVSTSIYECRETGGYLFELVDVSSAIRAPSTKIDGRTVKRKITCITTGKMYNSLSAAARDCNIDATSVFNSILNNRPVKGFLFEDQKQKEDMQ